MLPIPRKSLGAAPLEAAMEFRRDLGISQQSVRRGVVKGTFLGIVSTFLMKCFVLLLIGTHCPARYQYRYAGCTETVLSSSPVLMVSSSQMIRSSDWWLC
jgi:hypothetical protein